MKGKVRSAFVCRLCGYQNPRWLGRCPECGEYNTLLEELQERRPRKSSPAEAVPLGKIQPGENPRHVTGIGEVDRVFGGGLVQGAVALIGGEPGIGKSTLVLQIAQKLAEAGKRILYISAEESRMQIKLRAERLGVTSDRILVAAETGMDAIRSQIENIRPDVAIIDSIQMVHLDDIASAPGSVSQIRESAAELSRIAKRMNLAVLIIGHVTKEGALAGPKTLEHVVDAVFTFEGDRFQVHRILRSVKNRFGSTQEVGIFEMGTDGLREVPNPNELFISGDREGRVGSVVVPTIVGSRTMLVEIQALTSQRSFAAPMRRVTGVDFNRTMMIVAVLERRCGLNLADQDVFVNAVGGVQVEEPAADLGIALAVASSFRGVPLEPVLAVLGEVGLAAEIRPVPQPSMRLSEAARIGFRKVLLPEQSMKQLDEAGVECTGVKNLQDALESVALY